MLNTDMEKEFNEAQQQERPDEETGFFIEAHIQIRDLDTGEELLSERS